MYAPTQFDETRPALLRGLIEQHPLGTLITHGAEGLTADPIPFEIGAPSEQAPHGVLRAHVARANPVWRRAGSEALVVFQGASAYVSPSLYEEKRVSGKVVPTWNYAVVQGRGTLRAIEDPESLLALLDSLTTAHETRRSAPWSVHDAPRDYIDKLLNMIVGIEIPLESLQGKWKLSQNRSAQDQRMIEADMDSLTARAMQLRATSQG